MFTSTLLLTATALVGVVSAQNYSTSGPLSIDVSQIAPSLLQTWCNAQESTCPKICPDGRASPDTCDPSTLEYVCTCTDGSKPNISDYQNTVPFFVCQQWIANCLDNHPDDLDGQQGCLSVTCGNKKVSTDSGSGGSSSAAASASATSGGSQSSASASSSSSGGNSSPSDSAAMHIAQNYGTSILAGSLLALFGLAI